MPSSLTSVEFFYPIYSSDNPQNQNNENLGWLGRIVEPYFDFGQQPFQILPGAVKGKVVPVTERIWKTTITRIVGFILKFFSYLTLAIPMLMLVGKHIYRANNQFLVQEPITKKELQKHLFEAKSNAKKDVIFTSYEDIQRVEKSIKDLSKILSRSAVFLTKIDRKTLDNTIEILKNTRERHISCYKEVVYQLIESWYNAANKDFNTTERMELYTATRKVVEFLKKNTKHSYKKRSKQKYDFSDPLVEGFSNPLISEILPPWIASKTGHAEGRTVKYNGAYKSFHQLSKTCPKEKNSLEVIDKATLSCIEECKKMNIILNQDALLTIYSQIDMQDLTALKKTSYTNHITAKKVAINHLISGKVNLSNLGFTTLTNAIAFLGEKCSKILKLDLYGLRNICDKDIEKISNSFPKVNELFLDGSLITDKSASWFAEMQSLTSLHLHWARYIQDFNFLEQCKSLKYLELVGCMNTSFDFLPNCKSLTTLRLARCRINDLSILAKCELLANFEYSGQLINFSFLSECKSLTSLDLSECSQIGDFNFLADCKSLKNLILHKNTRLRDVLLQSLKDRGVQINLI